jgi:hypothetical protein
LIERNVIIIGADGGSERKVPGTQYFSHGQGVIEYLEKEVSCKVVRGLILHINHWLQLADSKPRNDSDSVIQEVKPQAKA